MSTLWTSLGMLLVVLTSTPHEPALRVERTVYLMGTEARITVEAATRAEALAASESAVQALVTAEERLSTWRSDSELARLNRSPVRELLTISPRLAADLRAAEACWQATRGSFDPSVGALVSAWGLRTGGRQPSDDELARALQRTGLDGLRWHGEAVVERRSEILLEEGGFGKGAGLADAVAVLGAAPGVHRAAIDLGGQVAMSGRDTEWALTLADPGDRRREVLELTVRGGSVATSGNSERGIQVAGRRAGHILDPRTGRPVRDFGSLTVWARSPVWADCLATGLYAAGPDAALAWGSAHPDVEILVLEERSGRLDARATRGFEGRLRPLVNDISIDVAARRGGESNVELAACATSPCPWPHKERGWRNPWQTDRDSSTPQ